MSIMLPTLLESIPEGMSRGWTLLVDGKPVDPVSSMILFNQRFGSLFYGKSPSGPYDQWSFHEVGGGGSVSIPFCQIDGQLYVCVLEQKRPLQSKKPILNVPRGFMDPKENHFETAVRETKEEAGIEDAERKTFRLPGDSANPNSAFFETWQDGEGVGFYGLEVLLAELNKNDDDSYSLNKEIVRPLNKQAEGIMGGKFIPWQQAAMQGDMFTLSAIARLLAYLDSKEPVTDLVSD